MYTLGVEKVSNPCPVAAQMLTRMEHSWRKSIALD